MVDWTPEADRDCVGEVGASLCRDDRELPLPLLPDRAELVRVVFEAVGTMELAMMEPGETADELCDPLDDPAELGVGVTSKFSGCSNSSVSARGSSCSSGIVSFIVVPLLFRVVLLLVLLLGVEWLLLKVVPLLLDANSSAWSVTPDSRPEAPDPDRSEGAW